MCIFQILEENCFMYFKDLVTKHVLKIYCSAHANELQQWFFFFNPKLKSQILSLDIPIQRKPLENGCPSLRSSTIHTKLGFNPTSLQSLLRALATLFIKKQKTKTKTIQVAGQHWLWQCYTDIGLCRAEDNPIPFSFIRAKGLDPLGLCNQALDPCLQSSNLISSILYLIGPSL